MIQVIYVPSFIRIFHKLPKGLQDEAFAKIELFKRRENHKRLDVHKNKGKFKHCSSFSVTYGVRIMFKYVSDNEVLFLDIDDHDIYR